jgi:hypothetical protein
MANPFRNTTGWVFGAEMVSVSSGNIFGGTVTASLSLDGQAEVLGRVNGGVCTPVGQGYYIYRPAQAETNATVIACTFVGAGAVPVTVQQPTVPT